MFTRWQTLVMENIVFLHLFMPQYCSCAVSCVPLFRVFSLGVVVFVNMTEMLRRLALAPMNGYQRYAGLPL